MSGGGRRPNPVQPRLLWVAGQYDPFVTLATLAAWSEATGLHGTRHFFFRSVVEGQPSTPRRGWLDEAIQTSLLRQLQMLNLHNIPASTRFDRYLPWVAREFNRMYRPYRKLARELAIPKWPLGWNSGDFTYRPPEMLPPDEMKRVKGAARVMIDDATYLIRVFRSIVDWAQAESVDLNRYDWDEAGHQAQEWAEEYEGTATRGEIVYEWPDGWTVQRLTTPEQLETEGTAMQHCVEVYAHDVAEGVSVIYSLRDPSGRPHATMEWEPEDQFVKQLRGKQNEFPNREYLLRMLAFRMDALPSAGDSSDLAYWEDFEPGMLDRLRERFLGVYLVGTGAVNAAKGLPGWDPWSDAFQRVAVYIETTHWTPSGVRSGGSPVLVDLQDLDDAMNGLQDWIEENRTEDDPDWEDDQEAYDSWIVDQMESQLRDASLTGDRRHRPFVKERVSIPNEESLAWRIWLDTGETLTSTGDELLDAIFTVAPELTPASGVIARGSIPAKERALG